MESVRNSIRASVGASQGHQLKERSPLFLIEAYLPQTPVVVFRSRDDTVLPRDDLAKFLAGLRRHGSPVAEFWVPGEHNFSFQTFDLVDLFLTMGSNVTHRMVMKETVGALK